MVQVASFSEVGGHSVNEDVFAVQPHLSKPDLWICFLADGQGGQPGGRAAAGRACQTALDAAIRCPTEQLIDPRSWSDILRLADSAVQTDTTAGFTTLIGFGVSHQRVVGASCGDSAVMLLNGSEIIDLTSKKRKNPPIGSGAAVPISFSAPLTLPWKILAMSDGVWKYVGFERIEDSASRLSGAELLTDLQQVARLPGNGKFQDDFTVVVLEED